MKKKKIYVSGPITGYENTNHFKDAVKLLTQNGFIAINPSQLEVMYNPPEDFDWNFWMRKAIKLLCDCDGIYFCEGSEKSSGCNIERYIAKNLGLELVEREDLL